MKSRAIFVAILIAAVAVAGFFYFRNSKTTQKISVEQKKTPHFLDSTPLHGEVYAAQPINVTINFDFDLAKPSSISVTSANNTEWTSGSVKIEDNKTALKKDLKQGMADGDYLASYKACWPDGSCHDGSFSFKIDSSKRSDYQDKRGQKEVQIDLKEISFVPEKTIISPGTKVAWLNADSVEHFVNTETHPEHTYFPEQNSRGLEKKDSFSTTFEVPGQYNYHCSAHADQMMGSIIVSD
jgi:plastocyanin